MSGYSRIPHPFSMFSDFSIDRRNFASKSQAALARERVAIAAFDALRQQNPSPEQTTTFLLLQPQQHLTCACWRTFSKHVKSFPGWLAKRRKASPEEKIASKEKRKGPVYFISVKYNPAKARKFYEEQQEENTTTAMNNDSKMPANDDDAPLEEGGRVTPE